jgi:hypothetical protein
VALCWTYFIQRRLLRFGFDILKPGKFQNVRQKQSNGKRPRGVHIFCAPLSRTLTAIRVFGRQGDGYLWVWCIHISRGAMVVARSDEQGSFQGLNGWSERQYQAPRFFCMDIARENAKGTEIIKTESQGA